jgi:hypothetical protein
MITKMLVSKKLLWVMMFLTKIKIMDTPQHPISTVISTNIRITNNSKTNLLEAQNQIMNSKCKT